MKNIITQHILTVKYRIILENLRSMLLFWHSKLECKKLRTIISDNRYIDNKSLLEIRWNNNPSML